MSRFILFLLLIYFCPMVFGQNDSLHVGFRVRAENLADGERIFITGNQPQLGNWQADRIPLAKDTTTGLWCGDFRIKAGEILEYKFTKGAWSAEAVLPDGTVPLNNLLKVENDTILLAEIGSWKEAFTYPSQGQVTGSVLYHHLGGNDKIKPRDIVVWLPPGYQDDQNRLYPVLYLHDGQNVFDPRTAFMGVDWQFDETADSLIRRGIIDPLIMVGIYNSDQRGREYIPNDTGGAYMKYVVEQVKPLIDSTYRTLPGRNHTAVAGSSLGGLISFMLLWEYPDIFSKAACFSPAFKTDRIDYVTRIRSDGKRKEPLTIYIDNGGIGLEEKLQPGIDEMLASLKRAGYQPDVDFFWYKDPAADHSETAWARRAWRPLILFWGKRPPDTDPVKHGK
jgi:predicted alpha/beta superfamily hydrolase